MSLLTFYIQSCTVIGTCTDTHHDHPMMTFPPNSKLLIRLLTGTPDRLVASRYRRYSWLALRQACVFQSSIGGLYRLSLTLPLGAMLGREEAGVE